MSTNCMGQITCPLASPSSPVFSLRDALSDELTAGGTVIGFNPEGERVRVHLEVSVHNQDEELTLAGTASGLS